MTFTISKTKLAISIVAVAMLIPSSAMAFHVFDDVPDEKFYADPVEWAFDNGITTGKTSTMFAPEDNVTRGESVTFLKRYDDNIVQPALTMLTPIVAQSVASNGLGASTAEVTSVDLTLPDVCPGAPDSWTVLVVANGYFLTGGGGTGSATTGLSLTTTAYETGSVLNQNFDSTGQFREAYSTTFLFTVDAGTTTFYQLGSTSHAAGVQAAQNNLIAQSVSVTC